MGTRPNVSELRYSAVLCLGIALGIGYLTDDPVVGVVMGIIALAGVVAALQHGRS